MLSDSLTAAPPIDDTDLLAEFVSSNSPLVFEELVQRHSPMVVGVCRRLLQTNDADDAAQAVFVLLWQKARDIKSGASIAGWLHRTACHVCCNVVRSRLTRIKHEQHAVWDAKIMSSPAESAQWSEIRTILDDEVNRLPDKWRIPFVLYHLEHQSLADIAATVGSTIPTVGTWLQRARARLAERLKRRGLTIGTAALTAILTQSLVAEAESAAFVSAAVQSAAAFSAGVTNGAACSPAVAAIVKASTLGRGLAWIWFSSAMAAVLVAIPVIVWSQPILQTRNAPDFRNLQGEWREIAHERDGGPVDAQPRIAFVGTLKFADRRFHRYQTLADGRVIDGGSGTFLFVKEAGSQAIDFSQWQGTAHGIYQLKGDTLTLCVTTNGGNRPDSFSTSRDDGRQLHKFTKVK